MSRPRWINDIITMPHGKYRAEIKRYLLLLLIPVLLLALLYLNVNQVVTKQAEEYAELMVNHFYVQASSMLHEMQLVSNAILRDSNVTRILEVDSANALDSLYICDIIRDGMKESPYVEHSYLICKKSGNIYSDQGLFSSSSLPVLLAKIGSSEAELYVSEAEDSHMLNENGLAPYCIHPIHDANGNIIGALIVTLRMSEFLRIFYDIDAALCAVFNQDVYIASHITNINADHFDWHDEARISAILGEKVTCKYVEGDDYTFMVAVSRESYNRPLYIIIKWFFIYAVAVLLLGYLYLYLVSRNRYQRLSAMVDDLPVSYTGDQSFEHIYENIRKSLEDYRTQREHLQAESKEYTLHMLLTAGEEQEISIEQFQNAGIDPHSNFYYVATFFSSRRADADRKADGHGHAGFFLMLLRSTIKELADQYKIPHAFCGIPDVGTAILYGNDAAALREAVLELCRNVIEILTNSYTINIQATVSNPICSVLNLPAAFQEAQQLRNFAQSINSSVPLISQEDLQHSGSILLNGDFIRQEQILLNTIMTRKYDVVPTMVESILSNHVSALRENYALAQRRLQSISNILLEGVRIASIPGVSTAENVKAISNASSVRQLVAATESVYGLMAEHCRDTTSETDYVALACNYIEQNLSDKNLNVNAICEAAGVSNQRLTRMFQAKFHMAIAEYVNACRIKLVKELLADERLTIVQISQRVGYSNTETFTRNFKKIEGITASEYRKMLSDTIS